MSTAPSDAWFSVFPAPRIADVLAYVAKTWNNLRTTYPDQVTFEEEEPTLTDNLCEALADQDHRFAEHMDCDFQAETWELRRAADGSTSRLARADIRVILGAPGTPHFVLEFKKLDGSGNARWRYCHDGLNRFVEGKYAVGHAFGAMCAFTCIDPATEATAMASYISDPARAKKLECVTNASGMMITNPSAIDPVSACFDTNHNRSVLTPTNPITLLHIFLTCDPAILDEARAFSCRSELKEDPSRG
jgi:hypothetical protein